MGCLSTIKARLAAATPGPWRIWSGNPWHAQADITFAANAPEDVAWLCTELEQARINIVDLEKELATSRADRS